MNVRVYRQQNIEELHKLAQSGDPIVRAMALAILEVGAERREDVKERPTEEVSEKKEEVKKDEEGST